MNEEKVQNYVEVTASITMSKSLCIEVPEGATREEVLELAKKEFITPDVGVKYLEGILNQVGVRVEDINLVKNWDIDELEYVTDYDLNQTGTGNPTEQTSSPVLSDGMGVS